MRSISHDDPILGALIDQAARDSETIGLILSGSRGAGCADDSSDYDLLWILTDQEYDERVARGALQPATPNVVGRPALDLGCTCPRELSRVAEAADWRAPGLATARILLDKTGEVTRVIDAIVTRPARTAPADAAAWFDAYLNAFYRSLKAWQRGNDLGGRLHAADSALYLVRTLFALEGRWTPYWDRLAAPLETLATQGWPPGYLRQAILDLLRSGSPSLQREIEAKVESLLRSRGFGHVVEAWGGEIERVKSLEFDGTLDAIGR